MLEIHKNACTHRINRKTRSCAGPGEVVIDIKASGLCHSDVGALEDEGWMHIITAAPLIFGHECAGVISQVDEGVTDYKIGDKVGVAPIHPETGAAIGYQRDGGYASKLAVPAVQLVPMPDGISFTQGQPQPMLV